MNCVLFAKVDKFSWVQNSLLTFSIDAVLDFYVDI